MNKLEISQEIKTIDHDGNIWMIQLSKPDEKTNRWQLSFFFNEKEFSLSKPQNNHSAQNIWELLQKIKFEPKIKEKIDFEPKIKEKKTDNEPVKHDSPLYKERPTKRMIKK